MKGRIDHVKATINGIMVEGTPEEIHAFMQMQQQSEQGYHKYVLPYVTPTSIPVWEKADWYKVTCDRGEITYTIS
jgi:hypothetical protein